jgi:TonB-linked SusC/RagA family outer membrane protein
MQFSFAQKTVTGKVSDASGPLPGANIVVKGTKNATSTDFDGTYSIKAKEGDVLVFSFVGKDNKVATVGAGNVYNATLNAVEELSVITVTGALGIKKSRNSVTSTVQVIKADELTKAGQPNVLRGLVGKVSGVQINNTSNGVDGGTKIIIRGYKSINADAGALVVIDNVISSSAVLSTLPSDVIENVTIIKGAQGAALYGEQGANGVVLVSTRKGTKTGKLLVTLNSVVDFETIAFVPNKQSKYGQGWDGAWDPTENGGWGELLDGSIRDVGLVQPDGSQLQAPYSYVKDNVKQFYKDGAQYQNSLTLEAGTETGYALFSASNQLRNFIVKGDELKRYNVLFKGGAKFGRLSVDGSFNYNTTRTNQSDADETLGNLLQGASSIPFGLFENSGGTSGWTIYFANPFWKRDNNRLQRTRDFFNTSANVKFDINKNITLDYNGALQFTNIAQTTSRNELIFPTSANIAQTSQFYNNETFQRNYYGDLIAHFKYDLTTNYSVKFDLGFNMQNNYSKVFSQGGRNLNVAGFYNIQNVLNPDTPRDLRNLTTSSRSVATFANLDLKYKDYLFLNATGRFESTSKLLPSNRSTFYPSAGFSFIPTNAFESLKGEKFSFMKLYGNYTNVGSTSVVQPYGTQVLSTTSPGYPFVNTGNSYNGFNSTVDKNIVPETYVTLEGGVEFGFFNNRLNLSASVYKTNTKNLISDSSTSYTTGLSNYLSNVGELESKGFDLELGFTPIKTKDFNWNGRLSYSKTSAIIKSLNTGANEILLYDIPSAIEGNISAVVGEEFPALLGSDFNRDEQGRIIVDATSGAVSNSTSFKVLGKATPDYIINYTNTISYKGFSLSATMDYRTGNKFFSNTKYNLTWTGHDAETVEFDRATGFIIPNSSYNSGTTLAPVYTQNTSIVTGQTYDQGPAGVITYFGTVSNNGARNIVDGTAFKLREISLSYTLPKSITDRLGIESARFSINGRNLATVLASSNRGYADPEASSNFDNSTANASTRVTTVRNTSPNAQGYIQEGQYPTTKTFGFAINVSF